MFVYTYIIAYRSASNVNIIMYINITEGLYQCATVSGGHATVDGGD